MSGEPRSRSGAEDDGEYLALALYLSLYRFRASPAFVWHSLRVRRRLRGCPGFAWHAFGSDPSGLDFWSPPVWEDDAALADFVSTEPHRSMMRAVRPNVAGSRSAREARRRARLPSWEEAHRRLGEQEHQNG